MTDPIPAASRQAEAARYALLRRLAPSIRHHLVVNLQPIGMIYEVMERRLRAPEPDLAHLHDSAAKINRFARAALDSSLDVVTWLAPEESAAVAPHDAARECVGLLATSLGFRGYVVRNQVEAIDGMVQRCAVRNVLTAAVIHLTDTHKPAAELLLSAQAGPQGLELALRIQPSQAEKGFAAEPPYRPLEWADLQALAEAESVGLARQDSGVTLTLAWMAPTTA
jgi:hypothetical protein